jgi:hypothetical protein
MNVKAFLARLQSKYKKRFPNIKFVTAVSTLTGKGISGLRVIDCYDFQKNNRESVLLQKL